MTELAKIFPHERRIAFAGREWNVKPLTFNSLAKIEDAYGSLDQMDLTKIKHQRFLLWVILSPSEPSLTEEAVGDLLSLDQMDAVVAFIGQALRVSGLASGEPSGEDAKREDANPGEALATAPKTRKRSGA